MAKKENKTSEKSGKKKKPNRIVKWFRELKSEFKKVIWPTRKKVVNNTVVVLITMVLSSLFVFALDYGLLELFSWVLKFGSKS